MPSGCGVQARRTALPTETALRTTAAATAGGAGTAMARPVRRAVGEGVFLLLGAEQARRAHLPQQPSAQRRAAAVDQPFRSTHGAGAVAIGLAAEQRRLCRRSVRLAVAAAGTGASHRAHQATRRAAVFRSGAGRCAIAETARRQQLPAPVGRAYRSYPPHRSASPANPAQRPAPGRRSAAGPRHPAAPRPARPTQGRPLMRQLMWFRSDLRVQDNSALAAAMQAGPTVAVFLLSPGQWLAHGDAPCKVDFWLRNLHPLSKALEKLGVPLLIRQADTWEQAPQVIAALCNDLEIDTVQVNEEYGIHESRRDQAVADRLGEQGTHWRSHLDQLLFQPGSVLTKGGTYFQVFSQFRKVCYSRLHTALPPLVRLPNAQAPLPLASDPLPASVDGFPAPSDSLRQLWPAGEDEAHARLETFADEQISYYHEQRDLPAKPGTSQLSTSLAAGVL